MTRSFLQATASLPLALVGALFATGNAACGSTATDTPTAATTTSTDDAGAGDDADAGAADAAPPVDNGAPSTNYPAPHPPLPTLVNMTGGSVLSTPKLHLVTFPGYENTTQLVDLAQKIGASSYWSAVTSEYGVGAATYSGQTELTGETAPATITDSDVASYLAGKIESGAFGTPDTDTVYTIFYPQTTKITLQGGGPFGQSESCKSFGGYHDSTVVNVGGTTKNVAYAVIPTCPGAQGLSAFDTLTGAVSHEWVEAVTDPFPRAANGNGAAYSTVDLDHFIWILFGGTEAGDLCVPESNAFFQPKDLPFTVQRSWSNKSAKSHDPCVPTLATSFFDSAPVLPDKVTLDLPQSFGGQRVPTRGVKIPVGQSKTIEVDLFSDGPTSGPWTVRAIDALGQQTGSPTLDFSWDRTSGVNGEKVHLTITVKAASTFVPGAHPFIVASTLGQATQLWPALVVEK